MSADLRFDATWDDLPLELVTIRSEIWLQVGRDRRSLTPAEAKRLAEHLERTADAVLDAL